ncbi:MAG: efflux RND transporter periplasmic adaptor subunit [Candidatus Aminicenantes bacterium]|nr:MAG: efflux RND transporter periplasmic adaptor subunit [Candidatus Aminicenantes bacterium]
MRKLLIFVLAVFLALTVGCGKSGESDQGRDRNSPRNPDSEQSAEKREGENGSGQKRGSDRSGGGEFDIDALDIPDHLKEAVKSGKIPPDKVKAMLAKFQGGGEALPVSVAPVQKKDLNSFLILNGIVEPERKVEIFSRLAAYVKQIVKEEGAYVRENDILALLDDTEIKISFEQAKITLEQARLSLEEAENNYNRNKELITRELISEQEFQTQEAIYKQRKLDHQNSQESYKNLELQLNYTKIRALSDGYVTERLIEMGDRVNANQQVYTIEDFKPLLIRVYVPTSDAIKLEPGMPADVTTEVLTGAVFKGDVKLINPRIDNQTGTVKTTVEVFDDSLQLKPGMFVEVRIAIGAKEDVIVIPRKAILYKQNKTYVFVMNRNLVSQREISLGLTEEDEVEVTNGLAEGDVIVVVGVEGLKDGQRVDVIR